MLHVQSMVGVPERVDRYEPQYQTAMQPVMQSNMQPQSGYSYSNTAPVSTTYSIPAQRRYDYYSNSTPSHMVSNAPPSPPADEVSKGSSAKLPSISSLLEISDAKPGEQAQQQIHHVTQSHTQAPTHSISQQMTAPIMGPPQDYGTPESMSHAFAPSVVGGRMSLPSTPPLVPDGPMEGNQSPSTVSTHSAMAAPTQTYYISQPVSTVDSQSRGYSDAHIPKRLSITSQPTVHPYPTPSYTPTSQYTPTFVSSPSTMSAGPYYSESTVLPSSSLYQRPLPSNFPPPMPVSFAQPSAPSPWQHHHYISASSQSTYPQSQDRYVCQTCNKAFSRPSSLRIHTHSHTGEKPFKCSHAGCGKAFSVRSNMKRHERGCHAGTNASMQHI